jgi:quinolinate synthase
MKKITLAKIFNCLQAIGTPDETQYEIKVPSEIAIQAVRSINKMMDYSE